MIVSLYTHSKEKMSAIMSMTNPITGSCGFMNLTSIVVMTVQE
jgi:hypothetical protein